MRRQPPETRARGRGFTLIEVLVALMIVAIGLAALMVAVSNTARNSGYLRDKILAEWMALNRLSEVRLNLSKFGPSANTGTGPYADAGEIYFANRTWHYDTRYFDTSIATMKRVVVRVYAGDAKTKGNPVAESIGFLGNSLGAPGASNVDWTAGTIPAQAANPAAPGTAPGVTPTTPAPAPIATPTPTPAPTTTGPPQ